MFEIGKKIKVIKPLSFERERGNMYVGKKGIITSFLQEDNLYEVILELSLKNYKAWFLVRPEEIEKIKEEKEEKNDNKN